MSNKEFKHKLKRIVILKQPFTNYKHENILRHYSRNIFPECNIEIRENRTVSLQEEKAYCASDDVCPLPLIGFGFKTRKRKSLFFLLQVKCEQRLWL